MNKLHLKRLNTLARILREADGVPFFRSIFTMKAWGFRLESENDIDLPDCGTPACALGHYAARTDVQRTFLLERGGDVRVAGYPGKCSTSTSDMMKEHFGLDDDSERMSLFGAEGCNSAQRPKDAAKFIERFAKTKAKEYGLV